VDELVAATSLAGPRALREWLKGKSLKELNELTRSARLFNKLRLVGEGKSVVLYIVFLCCVLCVCCCVVLIVYCCWVGLFFDLLFFDLSFFLIFI
jgi:hypothetical protein